MSNDLDDLLVVETAAEAGLPLVEIERAVGPLRRVVRWAVRRPERAEAVRFLEDITAHQLIDVAARGDLSNELRDQLGVIRGRLSGWSDLAPDERRRRLRDLNQLIWRMDDVLGLPVDVPLRTVVSPVTPVGGGDGAEPPDEDAQPKKSRAKSTRSKRRRRERPEAPERRPTASKARERRRRTAPRAAPAAPPPPPPDLDLSADLPEDTSEDLVQELSAAGVSTIGQLMLQPPVAEEVVRPIHGAGRVIAEGRVAVSGRVRAWCTRLFPDGSRADEALLVGSGPVWLRWRLVPAWLRTHLSTDHRAVLVGEHRDGVLHEPELGHDDGSKIVRLVSYAVGGGEVRSLYHRLLPEGVRVRDPLPEAVRRSRGLQPLSSALRGVHLSTADAAEGRRRLAFEEAFFLQVGHSWERLQGQRSRGVSHTVLHSLVADLCHLRDVSLTDEQQLALEEIKRDLRDPQPMRRLLTGDVAAGKWLLAMLTAVMVAESKSQVLMLSPSPVAAELRFLFAEPLFRELGLVARLIVGEPTRAQRDAVRRGEVHVVFGSTDLIEKGLEFRRLGLVISEERARLGDTHRRMPHGRGPRPDLLVVAVTPVPVMALLTAFKDYDLTVLRDGERQDVEGQVFTAEQREEAYELAAAEVREGRQVHVVFPMTQDDEDVLTVRDARRVVQTLEREVFTGARVALFHGAMSRDERWRIYDDFRHHRADVLVSTTSYEDGPATPQASMAIVEQADLMNDLRLHRIRGQLATARGEPRCLFVLGEVPDAAGQAWVEQVAAMTDGFLLSELNAQTHGLDSLLAEVEPLPELRWFAPSAHLDLLIQARSAAHGALKENVPGRAATLGSVARERWAGHYGDLPCPVAGSTQGRRRRRRRRKGR